MAFAVKYRLDVQAMDGQTDCRVDILEDGWAGGITDLQPSAVPIVYRKGERNEDKAKIIVPTTLEITVKAESDFQFIALTEIEEQELKVQYYEDSVLQFEGWVLPDEYTEAYIDPPYDVRIVATDYLAQLKSVAYRSPIGNVHYAVRESFMFFIKEALLKTGLTLNIKENVNIYDVAMTTAAADSPLVQGTIDPIIFYPDDQPLDTYTVLEYLLKNFRCRLFQENATWYVEQINEKQAATFIERTYNSAGTYTSQTTVAPLVKLTRPDASPTRRIMRAGAVIDNDRPFKDVSAYYRLNDAVGAGVLRGFQNSDDWASTSALEDWTATGTTIEQRTVNQGNFNFACRINGEVSNLASAGYIESQPVSLLAAASGEITIKWLAKFNATTITTFEGEGWMQVRLEASSSANVYYFYGNNWNTGVNNFKYRGGRKFNKFQSHQITLPALPENGDLYIRFYQAVEKGSGIGSVQSVELTGFELDVITEEIQTTAWLVDRAFVNERVTFTTEKEIVLYGDGPGPNAPGAVRVGSTLTTSWARRGVTETPTLIELFLQLTANLYQKNAFRLAADLSLREGRTLKFQNTFADQDSVSTRKYYFGFYEWRPAEGILSVEGIQFIAGDITVNYEQFLRNDIDKTRWDLDLPNVGPVFFPGLVTPVPEFNIPALGGDIINAFDANEASPQLIKGKTDAGYSGITSSNVVINTTREDVADEPLRKITAKDFIINAYASKATPVAADRLVISDSEDSDELKVIAISDLPVSGSKWTEVANGIYRDGRVAIGTTTVGTTYNLEVEGQSLFTRASFPIATFERRITGAGVGIYGVNVMKLNRTDGTVANGQGTSFTFVAGASEFLGAFGALKRSANTGGFTFQLWNSGSAGDVFHLLANGGAYIGRNAVNFNPSVNADSLFIKGAFRTGSIGASQARYVKMGDVTTGTITPDRIWRVEIDGVEYDVPLKLV